MNGVMTLDCSLNLQDSVSKLQKKNEMNIQSGSLENEAHGLLPCHLINSGCALLLGPDCPKVWAIR